MTAQEKSIFNRIYRKASLLLADYHDAWDLSQEVYLELEKGRRKWERADSQWAWAMGVFHRQLKRFLCLRQRHSFMPLSEEDCVSREVSAEQRLIAREEMERALKAIESLNKEVSQALVLFSLERLSVKEIARIQNVAKGTVKWRIFEGRRRIASAVSGKNPEKRQP